MKPRTVSAVHLSRPCVSHSHVSQNAVITSLAARRTGSRPAATQRCSGSRVPHALKQVVLEWESLTHATPTHDSLPLSWSQFDAISGANIR
eukprot:2019225-Amphidinium_carterae.1